MKMLKSEILNSIIVNQCSNKSVVWLQTLTVTSISLDLSGLLATGILCKGEKYYTSVDNYG